MIAVAAIVTTLLLAVSGQDAPPVKVDLYYETLCPYSIAYFVDQLYPTWQQVADIMEVRLFPFGNANYEATSEGGWSFTCQHGDDECRGNMIHACAQKFITDINIEMDFVNCLLSSDYPPNAGPQCADEINVQWSPINTCISGLEGQEALHAVALVQEQLDPALYFVPWIVVDDKFSEDQVEACQTDMLAVICDLYTGTAPPACNGHVTREASLESRPRRSYKIIVH